MDLKALHKIGYGLYVVTSVKDGKLNGQIANTIFQITSEPPTVAVSIQEQSDLGVYQGKRGLCRVCPSPGHAARLHRTFRI